MAFATLLFLLLVNLYSTDVNVFDALIPGFREEVLAAQLFNKSNVAPGRILATIIVFDDGADLRGNPKGMHFGDFLERGRAAKRDAELDGRLQGASTDDLATLLIGLFVIVSRRKAITQVLGYIVVENGIYALGVALVGDVPLLVELGVLLDVFVAVFIMSIAAYHISREFDHIDVDQLDRLKG